MQSLKGAMLSNLREMLKLERAAHDSMFKFSITKLWPISLIAPQVDWIRITRMMNELQAACTEQKSFLASEKNSAPEADLPFLNLLPNYLDSMSRVAQMLGKAASYKQDILEKKIKLRIGEWNLILKTYNEASDSMVKAGIALHRAY
jgi:hypothetical protein